MTYTIEYWQSLSRCGNDTGEEFDWYALDTNGYLAIFTTAGKGPVCKSIWNQYQRFCKLEADLMELALCGNYEKVFLGPGNYSEWCDHASKGLFAFDYNDVHRTTKLCRYDLIAKPSHPIQASVLFPKLDLRWLPVVEIDFSTCMFVSDSLIQ